MSKIITLDSRLKHIDIDGKGYFGDSHLNRQAIDFEKIAAGLGDKNDLFVQAQVRNDAKVYHRNYLSYLALCWAYHRRVVLAPDYFWFGFATEVASIVAAHPEAFRGFFVEHEGKAGIAATSDSNALHLMPLKELVAAIDRTGKPVSARFLPSFSTTTPAAALAFKCAFADIVSPYYDYFMYMCGLPAIRIAGTADDWRTLSQYVNDATAFLLAGPFVFPDDLAGWAGRITAIADKIARELDGEPGQLDWSEFFRLAKCGSGTDVEVEGWIKEIFRVRPKVGYVENYAPHIARITYKQFKNGKFYAMYHGVFASVDADGELTPDFGMCVKELAAEPVTV